MEELAVENGQQWTFWPTPKISTYLYALCAGPFYQIEKDGITKQRLLCRKSYEKYLTKEYADEWFDIGNHAI